MRLADVDALVATSRPPIEADATWNARRVYVRPVDGDDPRDPPVVESRVDCHGTLLRVDARAFARVGPLHRPAWGFLYALGDEPLQHTAARVTDFTNRAPFSGRRVNMAHNVCYVSGDGAGDAATCVRAILRAVLAAAPLAPHLLVTEAVHLRWRAQLAGVLGLRPVLDAAQTPPPERRLVAGDRIALTPDERHLRIEGKGTLPLRFDTEPFAHRPIRLAVDRFQSCDETARTFHVQTSHGAALVDAYAPHDPRSLLVGAPTHALTGTLDGSPLLLRPFPSVDEVRAMLRFVDSPLASALFA